MQQVYGRSPNGRVILESWDYPLEWFLRRVPILETLIGIVSIALVYAALSVFLEHPHSFRLFLTDPSLLPTILRTAKVCLLTASLVVVLGYILAFFSYAHSPRLAGWLLGTLLSLYVVSYYFILLGWRAIVGSNGFLFHGTSISASAATLGYGPFALVAVMVVRYLPVGALLIFLRVRTLPVSQIYAASNLGLSIAKIHTRLYLRWSLPALWLVFVFTCIFAALDYLASSLAGGGNVPTLADLLLTWNQNYNTQGMAMCLGLLFIAVVVCFLCLLWHFIATREGVQSSVSRTNDLPAWRGRDRWLFGALSGTIISVELLLALSIGVLAARSAPASMNNVSILGDRDLRDAVGLTVRIGVAVALAGTMLSLISVLAYHIRKDKHGAFGATSAVFLLIPLVMPSMLTGLALGLFQGRTLHYYGSLYSICVIHIVLFAPFAYFVLLGGTGRLPESSHVVAGNLGVRIVRYVRQIFYPTCKLGIAVAILLVFAFSLNESVVSRFVGGDARPLAVLIADRQVSGMDSKHYVVIGCLFMLTLASIWSALAVLKQRERSRHEPTR